MGFKKRLIRLAFSNFAKLTSQKIGIKTRKAVGKPTGIFISITNRCNLRCKQCEVPLLADPQKELSTEQWKGILRNLADWLSITVLRFSGGEPFLREDMPELIEYGNQLGLLSGVITNGQLIDHQLAARIVQAGTFNVSLSIDGMQKGHDFVRGDGSFEKVSNAAGFLNKARKDKNSDMRIIVKVTMMETNLDEIVDLVKWVRDEGLTGISISPLLENLATSSHDDGWFEKSPLWIKDSKKLDKTIDTLVEMSGAGSPILNPQNYLIGIKDYFRNPTAPMPDDFQCHVGYDHFRIDPNGDVYLCPLIKNALVGNVVESTPSEIWFGDKAVVSRKEIAACRRNCLVACQYKRSLKENFSFFMKLFKQPG